MMMMGKKKEEKRRRERLGNRIIKSDKKME
jgi:hypothetical protein